MTKQFCEYCICDTLCDSYDRMVHKNIDGIDIEYLEKYYICSICHNIIYGDYFDYNNRIANNELRKKTGLITVDEINEILTKYSIGKKPLSLVLGLGEVNIIRYLNGTNPTREISDLLKMILHNPFLYELFLQGARDNITKSAYKKSLGKTKQIELTNESSKLYNCTLYIIHSLDETDALSIQKLLFFANGFAPFFLGKELFHDKPEAWIHGPVYREIYDCFSYYGRDKIDYNELLKNIDITLDDSEKAYLDEIIHDFACYSGSILREMTHMTDPWIDARKGLNDEDYSNRIIDENNTFNYFKKIYDQYHMKSYLDISKYSDDLFHSARANMLK